jgi:hypothetical protein
VISAHRDDLARRAGRWDSVRIALALDDERRHGDRIELGETALPRLARADGRRERKRKTEDPGSTCCICGPARDTRTERAAAGDEGQVRELHASKVLDHRDPGRFELGGWCGGTTAGDAIRLLDEDDRDVDCVRSRRRRHEIGRADAAAGAVTQNERAPRLVHWVDVRARSPVRRFDLQCHGGGADRTSAHGHPALSSEFAPTILCSSSLRNKGRQ